VADWETKRAWHDYAIDELKVAGYEVSSAYTMLKKRAGKKVPEFLYRDALWHGADLLGTGVASFGHVNGVHMQNVPSWGEYLAKLDAGELPLGRAYEPTDRERLTRELILQMKLGELDLGYFRDKFEVDPMERFREAFTHLREHDFLEVWTADRIRLTRRGLLQVDSLLPEFYAEKYRGARYT
jgi:oxygen-independent coproporphyrinogen-3 oxidase